MQEVSPLRPARRLRRAGLALLAALAGPVAAQDLSAAFRHALQHDSRLAAAAAQRDAQAEKIVQGRAGLMPRVGLAAGNLRYSSSFRGFSESTQDSPSVRSTNVALSVVQPLYNRAAWAARGQGQLQAELGEAQWVQARAELASRLVLAWFDAVGAQGQADLAREQRTLVQARLAELGRGALPPGPEAEARDAERRDLESRLRRLQAEDIGARNQLLARRWALGAVAGPLPARLPEPTAGAVPDSRTLAQLREVAEQAEERSPNTRVQRLQVALADNGVAQSRAAHAPVVELTATYSNDRGFQMLPTGNIVGRSIGVQVQLPLFDGFGTVSRTREAQHLREKSQHELDAARSAAGQEAMAVYLDLESALARADACASPAPPAGLPADTLDARLEELASQRECQRARLDVAAAALKLRVAAGTFTEPELDTWIGALAR